MIASKTSSQDRHYTRADIHRGLALLDGKQDKRKGRPERKTPILNYVLSLAAGQRFIDAYPAIFGTPVMENNQYLFSRGQFYSNLNKVLQELGLKTKRHGVYGFVKGSSASIHTFIRLLSPDGVSGLPTNKNLHLYMSDIAHSDYHHFIRGIYDTECKPEWGPVHLLNVVLQSLLHSCDPDGTRPVTILGQSFTLRTIPLIYLSRITSLPIFDDVIPCELTGITPDISNRFIQNLEKAIRKAHLLAYIDLTSESQVGSRHITYDSETGNLSIDTDAPVLVSAVSFNMQDSLVIKTVGLGQIVIPSSFDHVFVTCYPKYCQCDDIPDD